MIRYYANAISQNLPKPDRTLMDHPAPFVGLLIYGLVALFLATFTLREMH